jgi:hypothetical protein
VNTADSGWSWFQRANTDPSLELRFDYMNRKHGKQELHKWPSPVVQYQTT